MVPGDPQVAFVGPRSGKGGPWEAGGSIADVLRRRERASTAILKSLKNHWFLLYFRAGETSGELRGAELVVLKITLGDTRHLRVLLEMDQA